MREIYSLLHGLMPICEAPSSTGAGFDGGALGREGGGSTGGTGVGPDREEEGRRGGDSVRLTRRLGATGF